MLPLQEQDLFRNVLFFSVFLGFRKQVFKIFFLPQYKILALFGGFARDRNNLFTVFMRQITRSNTQAEHDKWMSGKCSHDTFAGLYDC